MEYAAYEKCGIQVYCSFACLTSSVLVSLPSAQNSIVRREQVVSEKLRSPTSLCIGSAAWVSKHVNITGIREKGSRFERWELVWKKRYTRWISRCLRTAVETS